MAQHSLTERHACRLTGVSRSTLRYRARQGQCDAALRLRLKELASQRMRFGYRRLKALLTQEGMAANHKRVYRIYREEGLAVRIRQRKRLRWSGAGTATAGARPNQRWSIDFVSDSTSGGRVIRLFTMVDTYTRECPAIEVDTSLGGLAVCGVLERVVARRKVESWRALAHIVKL